MSCSVPQRQLCTFFLLPVLWLAVSGFQPEQPAKPRGSETLVSEVGSKPEAKPAWKWTLEERFAARFDPAVMEERQAQYQAEQEAIRRRKGGSRLPEDGRPTPLVERRDGRKTPELFLPGELFDILLDGVFDPGREGVNSQGFRTDYERWAAALGLGSDFWGRLEEAAAPYLVLRQKGDRLKLPTRADIAAKGQEGSFRICRARFQALEAAKAEFGEEVFLRLLYEGVAPSVQEASLYSAGYQRKADALRFQEGGCR